MNNIAKSLIIRPGTVKTWERERWASIFCKISVDEKGNLSISGVIGPLPSGNCLGSAGQIDMNFKHRNPSHDDRRYKNPIRPRDINFRPGWTVGKWYTFLEYWKLWHLNDMRPGCKHQTAEGWGHKEIKLVKVDFQSWKCVGQSSFNSIKTEIAQIDKKIQHRRKYGYPITTGMHNGRYSCTTAYVEAKAKAYNGEVYSPNPDSAAFSWIGENKPIKITTETKTSAWLTEQEHPEGVMSKPCPICGYKYGSAWKREPVPREVLNFLFTLPAADKTPPWV